MKDFAQMEFMIEIIKIFIPVAGSLIIAVFLFMNQKEYELVRNRYLENGLDVLTSSIDSILTTSTTNFLRSMQLLKIFRDFGPDTSLDEINSGYIKLQGFLPIEANERLKILLGGNLIFWDAQQTLIIEAGDANIVFFNATTTMLLKYKDSPQEKRDEIVDTLEKELTKRHKELMKYWIVRSELHAIKRILEKEKFSFLALDDFPRKVEIIDSIKRIEDNFGEKIKSMNIPPLDQYLGSKGR